MENVLVDSLLRLYSNDVPSTVWARSKYTYHDMIDNDVLLQHNITNSMPICTNMEVASVTLGAGTGCPKTGHEFEACMRDFFILKGPREQKEGEKERETYNQNSGPTDSRKSCRETYN